MVAALLTCARFFQDWPWRSWKLASLKVLRSGSSSEIQSSKTQWTNWNWKRGRLPVPLRSLSSGNEGQKLSRTCQQYADCFQKSGLQRERQNALPIFTYGPVSWVQWAEGEIPSGPERDEDQVLGSLGHSHDDWLLLESEKRPPCHWALQGLEETEVQALKFEQWWSNMQIYVYLLYQYPPFSLQ